MAEVLPPSKDMEFLFKKLRAIPTNKVCFDCTAKNPTWASVTYGVFICIDCSAVHRSLGVHVSFVRSTQLDTNWTWTQLTQMQLGGNANAETFFQQHNCTTKDSQQKYNSRAAQLYKDKLHSAALQSVRLHGPKITFDHDAEPLPLIREREFDFFNELSGSGAESKDSFPETSDSFQGFPTGGGADSDQAKTISDDAVHKHIIGSRKMTSRKGGLGCRKGGLGAQKITTNFADIEKEAELASSKLKLQEVDTVPEPKVVEETEEQITSMRLVYEDLSLRQKKEEEKLKSVDPSKAKQMERLGMGFATRSGVSHTALNDMKTIQQENVAKPNTPEKDDDFFDFDFSLSSKSSSEFFSRDKSDPINSLLLGEKKDVKNTKFYDSAPHNEKKLITPSVPITDEAQKKFGSAKSISSQQFFSDSSEHNWERSANLSRFEGSSSISSADYFNRSENIGRGSGSGTIISSINTPDLDDVKESVRQGVVKVAGRISSLANGVVSSIQEKYGGY